MFLILKESGSTHGSEGECLNEREGYGDGKTDAKLKKVFSDDAFHEDNGNKNGDQGQGCGNGSGGDFFCAVPCRLEGTLSHFSMAHNIFQNHDGVVDDDTHH